MKQVIYYLLTVLFSMVGAKAYAYDIAVNNTDGVTIYYNYSNNGQELEVTSGSYSGSVSIPEEVTFMNRTRKVTSIGDQAFQSCHNLTSVTIPNSVKSIGDYAFQSCHNLTSVTIPNSVTSIGQYAFGGCSTLKNITIGNSVTSISQYAFQNCYDLESITIPNSVTSIGQYAFNGCSTLTSITIGNSVTSIGDNAFQNCYDLESVTIPNSVTSIGQYAFNGCSALTSITIPNSVMSINKYTFSGCKGLKSVTIGRTVWKIDDNAFSSCSGLQSIIFPNFVRSIGDNAFAGCTGLKSVTFGNSVTNIGADAFSGPNLESIVSLITNPTDISESAFSLNTFNNATLYIPEGTMRKYKTKGGWKKFLFIEEGTGGGENPTTPEQCAKPKISYQNGKLTFACTTEGANCQYSITDTDIKAGSGNEVNLTVTYAISVYATKAGYENSEDAFATLCWIDVEPKTEGIADDAKQIMAEAVLIQNENGIINVHGVDDGKTVSVYNTNGILNGTGISHNGGVTINTSLQVGSIAIIKIGDKSVKVILK